MVNVEMYLKIGLYVLFITKMSNSGSKKKYSRDKFLMKKSAPDAGYTR